MTSVYDDEEKANLLESQSIPLAVTPKELPILSLVASFSYGFASLAMVFLNKAVLQQYSHSMTLLTLQQAATAFLIYFGGKLGMISIRSMDLKTSKRLLPLSLFYNANVAFALASLKGINVPMYIALKRLTPLTVLLAGFFYGKARPSPKVTFSVMLVGLGVIIAAAGDFSFDPLGYAMALTSVLFQTAYLVLVEKSGADDGLSSTELMLFNSVLSLPFLAVYIIGTGELSFSVPELLDKMVSWNFTLMVVLSLIMGIVLNFTMFLCTIVNSALTTTIVGVLKGVGSTILGFLLLGGVEVHALNVTGLVINTLGGISYSFVKYNEKAKKKALRLSTLPPSSKHLS
ncbi:solute carrier family 35, member D1/2/3 [Marchantia polymorpha subsp. ruderalis]|uniref:Sugar phosphate transporter domain-containing protein n=2 Tax=Marchantia polymorpha TaxID=3197 RepID=A0A176W3P7_MARPO|nr:hypothetical protein AXG93_59s1070 [Marchantia polymorpha subsp. ruderalis]PTQ47181.1 hypothetical protein MARPO_0009s0233 [Marchantia polymorpha]PTQ47182.1 hypothetical protein MARPO_0009s0233 [Marchantia polymorpha]BBN17575.1 hypothetical protein Mp_7g15490 [Marchantia polymorpha subsp. ruderalis]BBN17576.1 hypothetical protein Mp_7g15490 [Marchantia polymorpha subsp. ruderalis]|eukprot:PTQ47181.1 hypothetical protein MARPO_0009s0233 [Marchantia polymorpha]